MKLTPAQWESVKSLFDSALECTPEARSSHVRQNCRDGSVVEEVERLLANYQEMGSFITAPAMEAIVGSPDSPPHASLAVGDILAGRFSIVRFIARGGMGEVYEAEDLDLRERVALKILRPTIAADRKSLEALKREIHCARVVTHPNVNRMFDLAHHRLPGGGEVAFLTMELLEGETLADRLKRAGRMTISEAWPLIEQMAAGLSAAHKAGIVHRDFKPGNVMLVGTPTLRAIITDFGLSHAVDTQVAGGGPSSGSASGVFGTAPYIAPEQLEGGPVTPATDVYALGVVLYEMLTGTVPFGGQSPFSVAMKRLNESPVPPHAHVPDLDAKWQKVILRCLERDPADRFPSTADVVTALCGKPVGRASRTRLRTSILAGGLTALTAAVLWWPFSRNRLPTPPLSSPVRLTNDGRQKSGQGAVDASWIYFPETVGFRTILAKASLSPGKTQEIGTPFPNVYLLDSSPDQAELLVASSNSSYGYAFGPRFASPIWRLPTSSFAPHRVGHVTTHAAAWSPDGRHIAYAAGRELREVDTEGNNARVIATAPADIGWISWSPDGETVAFDSYVPAGVQIDWKVHADGRLRTLWAPLSGAPGHVLPGPTWTPDGKYFFVRAGDGTIWLVPQSKGFFSSVHWQPIQLNLGLGSVLACFSKNGKKAYAVVKGTARHEFMIYDRRANDIVQLKQLSSISASTAAFSPNGKWIAYSDESNSQLWRSKSDGTGQIPLTSPPFDGALPAWSPDGSRIAFMGNLKGKESRIYSVARDGGEPRPVVPESVWPLPSGALDHWQGGPTWSPGGKQIAFGENGGYFPLSPACAVHIFDIGTQRLSTIPHSEGLWTARWSPSGRYLAALTRDDEKLMLYDFQTQKWTLLDGGFIGDNPAWSHDGRYLYYLKPYAKPPAIMRLRVPGGKPECVADLSILDRQRGNFTQWSGLALGDIPLLIRRDDNNEIYAYDLKLPQ